MIHRFHFVERPLALLVIATFILSSIPVFPKIAEAAPVTVFEDGFGDGADSTTITGWEKHEAATFVREGQISGEDIASPDGGRFAKISEDGEDGPPDDGYICTEIDAADYTDLRLSYYWNGDFEAESSPAGGGGPDLGKVEVRDNGVGDANCGANGGWDELQSHDLTQHSDSWHQVSDLDISDYDGKTFTIRFRNQSTSNEEWFRVDGIEIEGESTVVDPVVPECSLEDDVELTTFDTFSLSSVNGQNDWSSTGPYDQEVVENTYGFEEFGCKSLRISNAVTTGAFGDQTFAAPTTGAAGESTIAPNNHFEAQFDIASTMLELQPGLALSVSPDDGNGSRMSYLSFTDTTDGIDVVFYDVTNAGPLPGTTSWNATEVATLNRSETHTVKFVMDFVDGPANDVVQIYINGSLVHTGTSWEDYYRYDSEQTGNGNVLFPVDTLIFRAGGTAVPANDDNGFLFDNLSLLVSEGEPDTATSETIVVSDNTSAGENLPGWMFNRDPGTATPFVFDTEEASMPDGSLHVLPIGANASDKFIAENFINTPVADIESISYDFMIGAGGEDTDEEHFYMNVYANFGQSDDLKFYDCRYNIVPTVGSTGDFTTVTFDPTENYPVTTRTGGDASPFTCPASPADMDNLSPGSNIRVFSLNVGDTSVNDVGLDGYLDKVVTIIDEGDNTHTTTYNFEPQQTSEVTICKLNDEQDPLEDWTLMLLGDKVETVNVPSNGNVVSSVNNLDGDYAFVANGTYIYRPDAMGSTTDAAFTMRTPGNDPIDPTTHPYNPWVLVNDLPEPWDGALGIIVDGQQGTTDWGSIFNPLHEYALQYTGDGDAATFNILDDSYGDNSGSLSVDIYEGYSGVTGKNGCVTFTDVPYGNYQVDEIMQDGWSNVSGLGAVVVDGETESFEVVNTDGPKQCVDDLDGDWADNVVSFDQGKRKNGTNVLPARSNPEDVLGESDWTNGGSTGFTSLGFGGSVVVSFDTFVPNVAGNDISIHEATNGTYPAETALVEVSQDGDNWQIVGTSTSGSVTYHDFNNTGFAWIKYVRVTDTSNPALHANDADGFDLDAVDATQTVCVEPVPPQMCSVTVVSDDTNMVDETNDNAVIAWAHSAWTAVIDSADWIWGSYKVEDPTVSETQTFVKTFDWNGNVASSTLQIATDNTYVVILNGVEVASSTNENNFQLGTQDAYNLSSYIEQGENTLEIQVTNNATPNDSNPENNPAGLKYNLTVVSDEPGEDCMVAPEAGLEITSPAVDDMVLSGEYTFEAEYIDADNNADPVQWAIRANSCLSGVNTVAGNVDGFSTPFMWNGSDFSSVIDMSGWDEGEYCFVVNPTEDGGTNFRETRMFMLEHPEPTQCVIVSDTTTLVVENNAYAVETWDEHSNWTHDINGATWIWDEYEVSNPEASTTRTFKETFNVTELGSSTLKIAADNTYTVRINGDLVAEKLNVNNFQTPDEYDVSGFLEEGENEMVIEVTNIGGEGEISKTNPAGVLFRLEMDVTGQCEVTTAPEDGDGDPEPAPTYEVFGFAWDDNNEDNIKNEDESYLGGVAVSITNGTTSMATTTDAGGRYFFMVGADTWTLSASLDDWNATYPDATNDDHVVIVTATSGPHDFGFEEDQGGSSGGIANNDDDNDGPSGQVAGASTSEGGMGGGIDIWEDLVNEISNSNGPVGMVLGASAEAQELEATTTVEIGDDEEDAAPTDEEDEDDASSAWKDWLCDYLWLLPLLWIIVSALAYWRKESYNDPRAMIWTQIIFGVIGVIFLLGYMITGVPCAWIPSAIVAIGAGLMSYYGRE